MVTTWKHKLLLFLSFLSNLSLFCLCWFLLLDSRVSRLVTKTVLRQEVVVLLEQQQQELVACFLLLTRLLACLSSLLLSCSLLALAGLSLQHRLAPCLLLPWCGASALCSCLPLAGMLALLLLQPWPLSLPLVAGQVCCLLVLLRLLLLHLLHVVSLATAVRGEKSAGGVWGRMEDDIQSTTKMDKTFLLYLK